jgi:hypothetical protein
VTARPPGRATGYRRDVMSAPDPAPQPDDVLPVPSPSESSPSESPSSESPSESPSSESSPREYHHRVAPKYRSFIATGVLLGVLAMALLYWLTPRGQHSTDGIVGYVGGILVIIGGVLGAAVALLIERGQNRRSGRR